MRSTKILDSLSAIVREGTYGNREEWLYEFEKTKVTNVPPIFFTDAVTFNLLVEEMPGMFCFVIPEQLKTDGPLISYFIKPIVRPKDEPISPYRNITLSQVWLTLVGNYHKKSTHKALELYADYRQSGNKKLYDRHKRYNCDFVTFCGSFLTKDNGGLDTYSGLLAMDFDKLSTEDRRRLWNDLLKDPFFETALLYDTPGGMRWVIEMDTHPTADAYKRLQDYCLKSYAKADNIGDVSRASFLFHCPTAYLNKKYER